MTTGARSAALIPTRRNASRRPWVVSAFVVSERPDPPWTSRACVSSSSASRTTLSSVIEPVSLARARGDVRDGPAPVRVAEHECGRAVEAVGPVALEIVDERLFPELADDETGRPRRRLHSAPQTQLDPRFWSQVHPGLLRPARRDRADPAKSTTLKHLPHLEGGVTEEVVEGEELWEGTGLEVLGLSGEERGPRASGGCPARAL